MLKEISGDLLQCKETFLCHQCNCVTNRSLHLAKSVFKQFPYADIYAGRSEHDKPGTFILKGDGIDQRYVINILGQYYPGKPRYPDGKRDGAAARLAYFTSALQKMKPLKGSFAFPYRIGCGAAGGDWDAYRTLIESFASSIEDDVVIYQLPSLAVSEPVSHPKLF